MSPYAPPRPRVTRKQRAEIFTAGNGHCYLCGGVILATEAWDADHPIARELGGTDDWRELRPAHRKCHRVKTRSDVALIAKSNRVRDRHNGFLVPKQSIQSRGFDRRPAQRTASAPLSRPIPRA